MLIEHKTLTAVFKKLKPQNEIRVKITIRNLYAVL